jgi:hypothetical protein
VDTCEFCSSKYSHFGRYTCLGQCSCTQIGSTRPDDRASSTPWVTPFSPPNLHIHMSVSNSTFHSCANPTSQSMRSCRPTQPSPCPSGQVTAVRAICLRNTAEDKVGTDRVSLCDLRRGAKRHGCASSMIDLSMRLLSLRPLGSVLCATIQRVGKLRAPSWSCIPTLLLHQCTLRPTTAAAADAAARVLSYHVSGLPRRGAVLSLSNCTGEK